MEEPDEDDDALLRVDLEDFDELELRIIAEKVMKLLGRDLHFERERSGLGDQWGGWRHS